MKKGFIHLLVPLAAIVVIALGTLTATATKRAAQLNQGRVLSSANDAQESSKHQEEQQKEQEKQNQQTSNTQKTASSTIKTESQSAGSKVKTQSEGNKQETEIETASGQKIKTKVEDDGTTKVELENKKLKVKYVFENGKLKIEAENESGESVDLNENEAEDQQNEIENELEKEDIKIATNSAGLLLSKNQTTAQTNFPITFDNQTNQLQVTTPQGQQDIAILPDQALAGILGSNITSAHEIHLTLENNTLAYKIKGLKDEKLFGVVPITTEVETTVSAQNGSVLQTQQALIDRIISLFAF